MKAAEPDLGLSTPGILNGAIRMIRRLSPKLSGQYLDIGAGHGHLIRLVRQEFAVSARACDYTRELMSLENVGVDVVDLNNDALPYSDETFDLVTCTEVIEHLEHYRFTLREIFRVLKPGGVCVVTTPNILNLKSRIRFLFFGFYNLFGPLHFRESRRYSTGGHINPVSHFLLVHALVDAGFTGVETSVDKHQRSSWGWLAILWLPLRLVAAFLRHKERTKYQTIDESNEAFVRQMNSRDILLGRTIIVGCRKKPGPQTG